MHYARLTFPELRFHARDAHKLRGYFGNLFREHSPLLHNHWEDGTLRYRYPLVQYKVIDGAPVLVGLGEGAELLVNLFLQVGELAIDGRTYPLHHKQLRCREVELGYREALYQYAFKTLWMALSQQNYRRYREAGPAERDELLMRILRGNILAALKGLGVWLEPDQRVLCKPVVRARRTQFKNQPMLAFAGEFTANVLLPDWMGLGKSAARGFGAVEQVV